MNKILTTQTSFKEKIVEIKEIEEIKKLIAQKCYMNTKNNQVHKLEIIMIFNTRGI